MDGIILVSVYLMIGIIFLKLYKTYFPSSYNFECWSVGSYGVDYDKDETYKESIMSIWLVLLFYPIIITWLIMSRGLIYTTKLIKWWVE